MTSDDFGYAIDLGLPSLSMSAFGLDPEIKRECIWSGPFLRPASMLVDRHGAVVRTKGDDGQWNTFGVRRPGAALASVARAKIRGQYSG